MKPVIGITTELDDGSRFSPKLRNKQIVHIWQRYPKMINDAGGIPVLLYISTQKKRIIEYLGIVNGILISGTRYDIPPEYYGEELVFSANVRLNPKRSWFEIELIKEASKLNIPILGICGGAQAINVAFGGSLYQDITLQIKGAIKHEQDIEKDQTWHSVWIEPDSVLARSLFGRKIKRKKRIEVNSTHHQAVKKLGKGLKPVAVSPDGVIEGIESEKGFVVGVQWHPELLYQEKREQRRLVRAFVEKSGRS